MKKLHFLALSMLLSTGYMMADSSSRSHNKADWQAKKAARKDRVAAEIGTNADAISEYAITQLAPAIANLSEASTSAEMQPVMQKLDDIKYALKQLNPNAKKDRPKKDKLQKKYGKKSEHQKKKSADDASMM